MALRWRAEASKKLSNLILEFSLAMLFRELKTRYELDEFDTTKKQIVAILMYAALLTLIASRTLLDLVIGYAEDDAVFPLER